jgi:hypothetical protein
MPYSRAKQKRVERLTNQYPQLRYSPDGKQCKLVFSADEAPASWTQMRPLVHSNDPTEVLDGDELKAKLIEMGVEIDHTWGHAHMKRIIDGDIRPEDAR